MPKYIAKQSIGHFLPGDEIEGLNAERIQALLDSGAIEEYKPPEEPQANSDGKAGQLAELATEIADLKADNQKLVDEKAKADTEIADLKADNQKLVDEKAKADTEIADLKAQVIKLDEQLKSAVSKKPSTKAADDAK